MMTTNDAHKRWANGTLGVVRMLTENYIIVSIDNRQYTILPEKFIEQEATYKDGKIFYEDILVVCQYPIVPAYAITIHKSQGQSHDNIICDIDGCFATGQAYVALSRCKSLNGLNLSQTVNRTSIKADNTVLDFYQSQNK